MKKSETNEAHEFLATYRKQTDWTPKIALTIAASATLILVLLTTLLVKEENKNTQVGEDEIKHAIHVYEQAPKMGDFELQYPSSFLTGDITVSRISGNAKIAFPPTTVELCQSLMKAAGDTDFSIAVIYKNSHRIELDTAQVDGRAITGACETKVGQPVDHIEFFRKEMNASQSINKL